MTTATAASSTPILALAQTARRLSYRISAAPTATKNAVLHDFADLLGTQQAVILEANERDIANAGSLSAPLRERLALDESRLAAIAGGVRQIAAQKDPIGEITELEYMPSGIQVGKMRIPLGVILMIYESRPNVTADAAALALKAGNAAILRGGSEAYYSNTAIGECMNTALAGHDLSGTIQVVPSTDRDAVGVLLACDDNIDLVIPRGGRQLIERVVKDSRIPVLKHMDGNCHVYIDKDADLRMALDILINAKSRRYGVCNAAESVLVHAAVAKDILPDIAALMTDKGVEMRACAASLPYLPNAVAADEADFHREYLAPIISVKTIASADEAIAHINNYGSGHTDAIVTQDIGTAKQFLREVDSSSVIVNASTGFADGGEYGLGTEIGISTNKLHARGPVGVMGLTTQKYIVWGHGECRS